MFDNMHIQSECALEGNMLFFASPVRELIDKISLSSEVIFVNNRFHSEASPAECWLIHTRAIFL